MGAKTLWLTEKPSQGREIAAGFDENFKNSKGWLESENTVVTWAIGHLIELDEPEDYGPEYKDWNFDTLPIIPARMNYHVKDGGKEQFATIRKLLQRSDIDSVIVASDCGREGELIARLILYMAGNAKPVYRFWGVCAKNPYRLLSESFLC